MNKILTACISTLFLVACNATLPPMPPLPPPKDVVRLNLAPIAPLNLTTYKSLQWTVIEQNKNPYVCTTLDGVSSNAQLLKVLEDKISEQAGALKKYKDYYEPVVLAPDVTP